MISREELENASLLRKASLQHEEKEYLQYIFLYAISKFPEEFVFKGGTCLRICYGLERASEDLDFSTKLNTKEIRKKVEECLKEFDRLNIEHSVYSVKQFEGNIRFEIRFKGPLFNGNNQSTNTLKLDFNKNKAKNKAAKVVPKLFSDVMTFTIAVMEEGEILTEKIRALINKKESRHMHDIWVLLQNNAVINKKLLDEKLKEEKCKLSDLRFPSEEDYKKDLKYLLSYLPPYDQVKREITGAFKKNGLEI